MSTGGASTASSSDSLRGLSLTANSKNIEDVELDRLVSPNLTKRMESTFSTRAQTGSQTPLEPEPAPEGGNNSSSFSTSEETSRAFRWEYNEVGDGELVYHDITLGVSVYRRRVSTGTGAGTEEDDRDRKTVGSYSAARTPVTTRPLITRPPTTM